MKIYENKKYIKDLRHLMQLDLPWETLDNKSFLISGSSGLIGSCLIDLLMMLNQSDIKCKVYALGRNAKRACERFSYCDDKLFKFITCDVGNRIELDGLGKIDYVIHLASNTHPILYSTEPIETITTNVFGTYNMLEFAYRNNAARCVVASSNEIYGENRGDTEKFSEEYCGYIDCNTIRAGYPESKRCSEALCQAFISEKGMNIVIPRLTRSYGPTMLLSDTKAISQFVKKGINGEDIVLKSTGHQYYSYTYVADAVSGILTVLLKGENGKSYNIADDKSDIKLKDLADMVAKYCGRKVIYDIPDKAEAAGYSKATKARLDSKRLQGLGWEAMYNIEDGLKHTIDILKEIS